MARPVIGIIGNHLMVENRFAVQATGSRNLAAVAEVVGALPLIFLLVGALAIVNLKATRMKFD